MALYLTEEQQMLADTARPFMADHAPVSHLRQLRDSQDATGFSRDLWKQFAEMGFTGILAGEADGGLGLGHVEAGVVLEEMGRNLTPSPFLSTAVGAVTALNLGSAEQRGRWLPGIIAGETVAALAFDEGARHRPERVGLKATRSGNGFRLDGTKGFVVHGHVADFVIVSARTAGGPDDAEGVTLFAVPGGAKGLTAKAERLADSGIAARLDFDGVEVDGGAVIGTLDNGAGALGRVLSAVRAGSAAEMLGVAAASAEMTLAYLKERKQFGQLIGSFQALQHRAAHLYSELEVARAAVLKAQQLLDDGEANAARADTAASVAKGMVGLASVLAVQEGVQMHGGMGMTDAFDIGLYMKRQRVLAELFGDSDYHAERLARLSGY
jgi:alkylation response protein AidB-like acyl-CoA dehydrogenase